jgi:tRNA pseudouridine55 synthase
MPVLSGIEGTVPEPASKRVRREVHGILLLDKPSGISSNAALQMVKRLYRARKAGHTGSLDPLASGVLPVCLGEATKLARFLLDSDKRYRVMCKLGERTRTGDAEGEVIETRPVGAYTPQRLAEVEARFQGRLMQTPPMYSALKFHGQPLYRLARRGIEVERAPREVFIHALTLTLRAPDRLEMDVACSKGAYVRTLVEDIGEMLGCGAHLIELRRTRVGEFDVSQAHTLEALQNLSSQGMEQLDAALLPVDAALTGWPELRLSEATAFYIGQGQAVFVPQAPSSGWVKLFAAPQRFLGVGEVQDDGRIAPRRLVNLG